MATLPLDGRPARYTESGNTLFETQVRDISYLTEIGNISDTTAFHPHIKVRQFEDTNDECWLSIDFNRALAGSDSVSYDGDTIVWEKSGYQVRIYPTTSGFNFDTVLPSRPLIDGLELRIESHNLEFHKQLPLTAEQIANGIARPERAINSYYVKRSDGKKDNQFLSGKVLHIQRPLITDALSNTTYGDISIVGNVLTISIDPIWLNGATYPITVDPDLGYTTIGASTSSIEGIANGYKSTMSEDGTLDSITAYCQEIATTDGTHTSRCGMYDPSDNLVAQSATKSDWTTTASWGTHTVSGSPSLTNGTEYRFLCGAGGGNGALVIYFDDNVLATNPQLVPFDPTTGYPDPGTAVGVTSEDYSIYFTYSTATTTGRNYGYIVNVNKMGIK